MANLYLGVDPGKTGGMALLKENSSATGLDVVDGVKMPDTDQEICEVLLEWLPCCRRVFVEQVPKFAGENRSAAFMCVLYGNYRTVTGAVNMFQMLHQRDLLVEMPLLLWMNQVILQKDRSRDRAIRKRQLQTETERIWPAWKWTAATCDAPLIALAGYLLKR
jgi:hypothetical protein